MKRVFGVEYYLTVRWWQMNLQYTKGDVVETKRNGQCLLENKKGGKDREKRRASRILCKINSSCVLLASSSCFLGNIVRPSIRQSTLSSLFRSCLYVVGRKRPTRVLDLRSVRCWLQTMLRSMMNLLFSLQRTKPTVQSNFI